jgi:hypothetical protein
LIHADTLLRGGQPMKALIVLIAIVTLLGCANTDQQAFDAPVGSAVKAGERAAEQQREATGCQTSRRRPSYALADASTGDAPAVTASFVIAPGSNVTTSAQIDDRALGGDAPTSNCRPRRRHNYYA